MPATARAAGFQLCNLCRCGFSRFGFEQLQDFPLFDWDNLNEPFFFQGFPGFGIQGGVRADLSDESHGELGSKGAERLKDCVSVVPLSSTGLKRSNVPEDANAFDGNGVVLLVLRFDCEVSGLLGRFFVFGHTFYGYGSAVPRQSVFREGEGHMTLALQKGFR